MLPEFFSYWEEQSYLSNYDLLIIGGGIVGLSSALHYSILFPKHKVAIIERGIFPFGASTRNAGFACFGSVSELQSDIIKSGEALTLETVSMRYEGLQLLIKTLGKKAISFSLNGGHEVFWQGMEDEYEKCSAGISRLNSFLEPIFGRTPVYSLNPEGKKKFGLHSAIGIISTPFEGLIDTGKMMRALEKEVMKRGIRIFNGINVEQVTDLNNHIHIYIDKEKFFSAQNVLVTTNGFASMLKGMPEVIPARAQVLLTEKIPGLRIKGAFHFEEGYYYFRNLDGRILFGGGRNLDFKGETSINEGLTEVIQSKLENLLEEKILNGKKVSIEKKWSGIMGIGDVKKPIIKKISPGIYCAVRMGGMGVAIGSIVGKKAAEMIAFEV
jgi:glycine/D-amino acid oxidase-like deaminating enzyme